ncbi:MAG: Fumble domain-containing protein [Meiothermus sp.]
MSELQLGVDFGLTNTDVALVKGGELIGNWTLHAAGPARPELLRRALEQSGTRPQAIATTGGLHRALPDTLAGIPVHKIGEAQALGRGGLALAGLDAALVVSAGTGSAMIAARGEEARHVTGSAVGGGTLLGLSKLLLGIADPTELAALAEKGDTGGVDSTLTDVIGGGIGHLPASATAVNFGRVLALSEAPKREDIAAGLVTLVAQVIGMISLNAVKAAGLEHIAIVGHLTDLKPIRAAFERVWQFYQVEPKPVIPERAGWATAFGAALEAMSNEQ